MWFYLSFFKAGSLSCKPVTDCAVGMYQSSPATTTSDTLCKPCASPCASCLDYQSCTFCSESYFLISQSCVDTCPSSYYGNGHNRTCLELTVCSSGSEEAAPATPTSDRVCRPCPSGTTDADSNPATPCKPCPPGSFMQNVGMVGNCTLCAAGTVDVTVNGGASTCVNCGPGYYAPPGHAGACAQYSCAPGTVDSDMNPATPCVSCLPGQYQPTLSATACLQCTNSSTLNCSRGHLHNCSLIADASCTIDSPSSSPLASTSTGKSSGGSSAMLGAIIGAVVGGVALLLLILVLLTLRRKQIHRKQRESMLSLASEARIVDVSVGAHDLFLRICKTCLILDPR